MAEQQSLSRICAALFTIKLALPVELVKVEFVPSRGGQTLNLLKAH